MFSLSVYVSTLAARDWLQLKQHERDVVQSRDAADFHGNLVSMIGSGMSSAAVIGTSCRPCIRRSRGERCVWSPRAAWLPVRRAPAQVCETSDTAAD